MSYRPFSEYRQKDYMTPRSLKEAYGRDVDLYVEEEMSPNRHRWLLLGLIGCMWIAYKVLTAVL